jgi:hypothetical protein
MTYGDNPIFNIAHDSLNRKRSVEALCRMLSQPALETPIVVGINGEWGSGKTSVMHMLESALPAHSPKIWFDAWRYARQDSALWRALLLTFVEKLRAFPPETPPKDWGQRLDRLVVSLYRTETYEERGPLQVNWSASVPLALQALLALLPGGSASLASLKDWLSSEDNPEKLTKLIERERVTRYREQVQSLEQFRAALRDLVTEYLSLCDTRGPVQHTGMRAPTRLYIFIDDLDRCLPEAVVGTLEAIKLMLDIDGCVFILGVDRAVVEHSVLLRYHQAAGTDGVLLESRQYLDKVIQVPFRLPALDGTQIAQLVESWCKGNGRGDLVDVVSTLIVAGVAPNPRSVKRTLNLSLLMLELRAAHQQQVNAEDLQRLVKLVILQNSYEVIYQKVVQEPSVLKHLEAAAHDNASAGDEVQWLKQHPRLGTMLRLGPRFDVLESPRLKDLIYLTRVGG